MLLSCTACKMKQTARGCRVMMLWDGLLLPWEGKNNIWLQTKDWEFALVQASRAHITGSWNVFSHLCLQPINTCFWITPRKTCARHLCFVTSSPKSPGTGLKHTRQANSTMQSVHFPAIVVYFMSSWRCHLGPSRQGITALAHPSFADIAGFNHKRLLPQTTHSSLGWGAMADEQWAPVLQPGLHPPPQYDLLYPEDAPQDVCFVPQPSCTSRPCILFG